MQRTNQRMPMPDDDDEHDEYEELDGTQGHKRNTRFVNADLEHFLSGLHIPPADAGHESDDNPYEELKISKTKRCNYYERCLEVVRALELSDELVDFTSTENKCYCQRCHDSRRESYHYTSPNGRHAYTRPLGWGRIMLKLPPRHKALNIFQKWSVAYHGTPVRNVESILKSGMLMLPGDSNLHGNKVREEEGHFTDDWKPNDFNTKQIFLSPSIKYAGSEVYAKKTRMYLPKSKKYVDVKSAFRVRIHPDRFEIGDQTIDHPHPIDPPIANKEIEWSTKARDAIIPVALLIHHDNFEYSRGDPWYAGKVSGKDAQRRLLTRGLLNGTFLIRESDRRPGEYSLSLFSNEPYQGSNVQHYQISRTPTGKFYMFYPETSFYTLAKLVEHYQQSADDLWCKLTVPCP